MELNGAELYEHMWAHDAYRNVAPGEQLVYKFIGTVNPKDKIIDFGCGTGRGAALIHTLAGVPVIGVDWAGNCLDKEAANSGITFLKHDLRNKLDLTVPYGYCTDMLEHVAPEDVDKVLLNILTSARKVFFSISTVPDHFGPAVVGSPLHLTVQPHAWWKQKLEEEFCCTVFWEEETPYASMFYVSAYATPTDLEGKSVINTEEDDIKNNILANLSLRLNEVQPYKENESHVYLLAGGPSLSDYEDKIIEAGKAGIPIITTNGTYNWLLARGIRPAAQIIIDAREFNKRFVIPVVDTCKYLIGSQAHPEVLKDLPKEQTLLWHSDSGKTMEAIKAYDEEHGAAALHYPVYGGSTVTLRALPLLAMLGFRTIEVFGWDSCIRGANHHAYEQKENDAASVLDITVAGKTFQCHPWMVIQAHEVVRVIKNVLGRLENFQMVVHGDGLIAHMLKTAADAADGEIYGG